MPETNSSLDTPECNYKDYERQLQSIVSAGSSIVESAKIALVSLEACKRAGIALENIDAADRTASNLANNAATLCQFSALLQRTLSAEGIVFSSKELADRIRLLNLPVKFGS